MKQTNKSFNLKQENWIGKFTHIMTVYNGYVWRFKHTTNPMVMLFTLSVLQTRFSKKMHLSDTDLIAYYREYFEC